MQYARGCGEHICVSRQRPVLLSEQSSRLRKHAEVCIPELTSFACRQNQPRSTPLATSCDEPHPTPDPTTTIRRHAIRMPQSSAVYANCLLTKSQLTSFQNSSTYFGRALRKSM